MEVIRTTISFTNKKGKDVSMEIELSFSDGNGGGIKKVTKNGPISSFEGASTGYLHYTGIQIASQHKVILATNVKGLEQYSLYMRTDEKGRAEKEELFKCWSKNGDTNDLDLLNKIK